jgi:molybdopterin adenylyltransferase
MGKISAVVITVSDGCARGLREDLSGATLVELLEAMGANVVGREVLPDDLEPLSEKLRTYAGRPEVNLIVTTGGTGFAPRDNTPEATRAVIETRKSTPMAMVSRGVCGIRSGTLIVNLPGSPKAVRESFAVIKPVLPHVIDLLEGKTEHKA